MLGLVARVETIELFVDRRPDGGARERPPRALGDRLDVRHLRGAVEHVVKRVIRPHPLGHQPAPVPARVARAQLTRQAGEPLLALLELLQLLERELLGRHLGDERLELRPDEERLAEVVVRERPDAHALVRLERDEPERRELPQRLAHRRPRDAEPLRQLLLAQDRAGLELAGHDRLLDQDGNIVGLRALRRHGNRS